MNERDFKEVDERFDKQFPELICKGKVGNKPAQVKDVMVVGVDIIIKDFIHSEILNAEKEARLEGARELADRIQKTCSVCDSIIDGYLAELSGKERK